MPIYKNRQPLLSFLISCITIGCLLLQSCKKDFTPSDALAKGGNKQISTLSMANSGSGNGYCWEDGEDGNMADSILKPTILGAYPLTYVNALATALAGTVDVTIGYNRWGNDVTSGNDAMAALCFHELTHAAHYNKVGNSWYGNFVQATLNEMVANIGNGLSPYGQGNTVNSSIIALGESWAYHMGHWLTNRKYGTRNIAAFGQNFIYKNGLIQDINFNTVAFVPLNTHVNLLEDFSPLRVVEDPFWWIPQGLLYDLMDDRNDRDAIPRRVDLNDLVSGFNNEQFFNALDADINNLPAFRVRLLNENPNSPTVDVNTIFTFYGN